MSTKTSLKYPISLPVTKDQYGRLYLTEKEEVSFPNLIEVQLDSYEWFLKEGLKELLAEVSPVEDFSGKKMALYFLSHEIEKPKYTEKETRRKNITYEAPVKSRIQLVNKETGEIKEQDVFLGNVPLMTKKGSFIVNGIERVVVNQLVRSPGAFFGPSTAVPGKFNAKVIPQRGAWLELETDKKGVVYAKIDRKRKFPMTQLLRIFGLDTDRKILKEFEDVNKGSLDNLILNTLEKDTAKTPLEAYQSIYKKIRPGDLATPENAKSLVNSLFFDFKRYDMGAVARYKINKRFGLDLEPSMENRVFQIGDFIKIVKHLIKVNNKEELPDDIDHLSNRRIRSVGELVQNKYRIGLMRMERIVKDRMSIMDLEQLTPVQLVNARPLTASMKEFFASSQLSQFMDQTNPLSELEHKRRLSAMGPGGLSRERASFDVRDVHASHYGRICPIATPEGPNIGLVLHLASYAKVNQYGFIETPFYSVKRTVKVDKKNPDILVGKILAEDMKGVGKQKEKITNKMAEKIIKTSLKELEVFSYVDYNTVEYIDADEEMKLVIAQANSNLDKDGNFIDSNIAIRYHGEPTFMHVKKVTHMDVSPKQIFSEGTALIPFIEHDDNTRASMGANMQRQSVSLIEPETPLIGTGLERMVATSTGQSLVAKEDGKILSADANEIVVTYKDGKKESYELSVFERSNQATSVHMKTRVISGDKVKKGDVLAEGASVSKGELALGRNLLVAYMPWKGYNFEDAIVISDRVMKDGFYDSVHIEEYVIDVRDTKLGPEIMTKDIPNVGEAKLKDLDEEGIVRIGAFVNEGDILVGKITPKGESELTPEERLLQAIFGNMAKDVKDTSLRLPGGEGGKVIDVKIFNRKDGDELPNSVIKQVRVMVAQQRRLQVGDKMAGRHGNKGVISKIVPQEDMPFLEDGTPVDIVLNPLGVISRMNIGQVLETHLGWAAKKLGIRLATPALNGIKPNLIQQILKDANLPEDGKIQLYDGFTGEPFAHKTVVGITYMLKLSHLIEDKMHARSVGPYSLVTQQPLGGKAQHGGQRFGEMEVWALESYAAAHTLQEMLTIKSDDVVGRSKAYEDIVKGNEIREPSIPESFNVLVHELQSLCLDVELVKNYQAEKGLKEAEVLEIPKEGLVEADTIEEITDEDKISELNYEEEKVVEVSSEEDNNVSSEEDVSSDQIDMTSDEQKEKTALKKGKKKL
jgi:DNA-directed RNA polymerase subunit beta